MIPSAKLRDKPTPEDLRVIFVMRNKQHSAYCENRKKNFKRKFDKVKQLYTMCFVGDEQVHEGKFSKLLPDFSIIQNT